MSFLVLICIESVISVFPQNFIKLDIIELHTFMRESTIELTLIIGLRIKLTFCRAICTQARSSEYQLDRAQLWT